MAVTSYIIFEDSNVGQKKLDKTDWGREVYQHVNIK